MSGSCCRSRLCRLRRRKPRASSPEGMVKIPEGDFDFEVNGIEIEGLNEIGVDVQYPWEDSPRRFHSHPMHVHSFYIDKYPVTNAEFKKFVDATHYHPKDDLNFLRDWKDGTYPQGWENKPVTWVSWKMRELMRHGRGSGCRMSGSGSMRRRERIGGCIRGAMSGTPALCRCRRSHGPCADRMLWMRIRRERVRLA